MGKSDPRFDRRLAAIFQAEATGHVQRMQEALPGVDADDAAASEPLRILFRAAHSLKGAARAVGEDAVEMACHAMESVLAAVQRGRQAWSPAIADLLHETVRALDGALAGGMPGSTLLALVPRLEALLRPELPEAQRPAPPAPMVPPPQPAPVPVAAAPQQRAAPPAVGADGEQMVRIGVDRLGALLYQVEELVAVRLQTTRTAARVQEVLASAGALRAQAAAAGPEAVRAWQRHESLLRAVGSGALREQRQLGTVVDTLLADVKKTLLVPTGSLGPFLQATVRELARSERKDVELRIDGDGVELDRRLLEQLREPLVHLLRNAIGHGLESPEQRSAAGKPVRGRIELAVAARSGGRVEITLRDDGAGIDTQRLARAARELHMPVPDEGNPSELLPLVFGAGVSTAAQLTQLSGRGIGLAIVRETVERLGGTIGVASEPGRGTTFTLHLTTSLATYRAIEVRAAGRSFLLPTARVEHCLRVPADAVRTLGDRQSVPVAGEDLPLASLAALLRLPAPAASASRLPCLLLAAGERKLALSVDEIRGEQEVLGKPIDGGMVLSAVVSGAAVLPGGGTAPILNVAELVRLATGEGGRQPVGQAPAPTRPARRAVLLAEDSITSRTLLKNILELAGHRVEVAVDGADALARLRGASFDVVVSDVEMPRMDGIELTRAIRRDAALRHLPVVLVTSLASPADRERGAEAGANAYIVKSSFDQGDLLGAIAELA